ncbi:hypothetical protein CDAR_18411 [Caerostris darwini]|uniref:Uncharacterized protein n=1 Tax=Caerostris darwini TaxID=1538125 RepID=A0AAV4V9K9_9ARAC|nr:hypothetical protein CDAR_18411 [Caerostris darwini]
MKNTGNECIFTSGNNSPTYFTKGKRPCQKKREFMHFQDIKTHNAPPQIVQASRPCNPTGKNFISSQHPGLEEGGSGPQGGIPRSKTASLSL